MAEVSDKYASPNLRLALLLEDHPGTEVSWRTAPGTDIGVPATWGGADEHVICTLTFPESSNLAPIEAGKESVAGRTSKRRGRDHTEDPDSESWERISTIALGRALKRAGYPPDMDELRAKMLWRRRTAEVTAIARGHGEVDPTAAAAAADERVLAAAGRAEDAVHADPDGSPTSRTLAAAAQDPRAETLRVAYEGDPAAADRRDDIAAMVDESGHTLDQLIEQARQQVGRMPRAGQGVVRDRLAPFGVPYGNPRTLADVVAHMAVASAVEDEMADAEALTAADDEGETADPGEGYGG